MPSALIGIDNVMRTDVYAPERRSSLLWNFARLIGALFGE